MTNGSFYLGSPSLLTNTLFAVLPISFCCRLDSLFIMPLTEDSSVDPIKDRLSLEVLLNIMKIEHGRTMA